MNENRSTVLIATAKELALGVLALPDDDYQETISEIQAVIDAAASRRKARAVAEQGYSKADTN